MPLVSTQLTVRELSLDGDQGHRGKEERLEAPLRNGREGGSRGGVGVDVQDAPGG